MRRLWLALALICAGAGVARAEGERAGDFDYYVMALSWSANWCALEGDARRDPQCDRGRGTPFVLHGLWPQNERGWPSYCRTGAADPTRGDTAAMADVFGMTLLLSEAGETFMLSNVSIWVQPVAIALSMAQQEVGV